MLLLRVYWTVNNTNWYHVLELLKFLLSQPQDILGLTDQPQNVLVD